MKSVEMTDIKFLPDKFDFEKTFNQHFGVIKDEAFEVEAAFTGWSAAYVAERIWSPDQKIIKKGKDKIILKFTASSEPELISWLLSFGEEATLIRPDWIVKELKSKIAKLADCYS
jgi:predicted DNA-binding transcriptional regulator YafY